MNNPSKRIYFDNAATTPMYPEVIDAMLKSMKEQFGNPSSVHSFGQEAKNSIELARKDIAHAMGVLQSEIIFTSCGTEGNNLIIRSCVDHLKVERIITSPLEHKCVLETTLEMKKLHPQLEVKLLSVNEKGDVDIQELEELLQENKLTLVSLMHANNEIGNLLDIEQVAKLCKKYSAFFHSDTVQTVGHYSLNLQDIPLDFATASAHKFHGPKGVGFVFIKKSSGLKAMIMGGGQERNMRSGTENVYGIVGMAKALTLSLKHLDEHTSYIQKLKKQLVDDLKTHIPNIQFNGRSEDLSRSLFTVLSVLLPKHNPLIAFQLDMEGIYVSQGSACSSGASKPSVVMQKILTKEQLESTTPLRISLSYINTENEIEHFVNSLKKLTV